MMIFTIGRRCFQPNQGSTAVWCFFVETRKKTHISAETNAFHSLCWCSLVLFFPEWNFAIVIMWMPLPSLQVSRTPFFQISYFFILLLCHSAFSPSLSCTHARPGSVGVWRMTHLLHTSSSSGHIWASRKSMFLQRSRRCGDNMMSSFLPSLFFRAIF